jgi:hypothetical protein
MPIPRDAEPEEPQVNAGLLEFINRRRVHQARQRRQRVLVAATAALALIAVVLAVSNVLLVRRLAGRAQTAPPASVSPPSPVASAPAPVASAPAPPDLDRARATARPVPTAPPLSPNDATPPKPQPPAASATPAPARAAAEPDSARRTARWLVQTHGRLEAENRAAKVAEFYSGSEGAFWRRVLLNVRQEPER